MITITVNGVDKAVAALESVKLKARQLQPALKSSAQVVVESVNRNFIVGGRPDRWKPLRPASIRRRPGVGDPRPLRDTGRLMASIGVAGKGGIMELTEGAVRIGTNVEYAKYHQHGIGVPKREFMLLQPEDVDKIVKVFEDHLDKP